MQKLEADGPSVIQGAISKSHLRKRSLQVINKMKSTTPRGAVQYTGTSLCCCWLLQRPPIVLRSDSSPAGEKLRSAAVRA